MYEPSPQRLEFDAKAEAYESNRLASWYQAQGDQILEHLCLAPEDVVLDIGCGTGHLLRRIAKRCPGVTGIGIDIAPRMIEVARARAAAEGLSQLTFVAADWEQHRDEAMRLIRCRPVACAVCVSAFHYFAAPVRALAAIHEVLRPGGQLLILDRARERSPLTVVWQYAHRFLLRDKVRFSSTAEIADMLEQAGFRDVTVLARLRRVLWKNKLYTSLALIRGTKVRPDGPSARSSGKMNDIPSRLACTAAAPNSAPWARELAGKRLLVTGAAGFIGGALCRRLRAYGCDVTGTVLHPHEAEAIRGEGGKAEVLDLASDAPFEAPLRGIDIVFHLGAVFQETEHGEAMYRVVNETGAVKLCQAAAAAGIERFVHCSTVGIYGDVKEIPSKETSPLNPMDMYHRTKLAGELGVLEFARTLPADGMTVTVNRPAMVYGPGDLRMLKFFKMILHRRFVMVGSGEVKAHLGYIADQVDSLILCAIAPRAKVHLEAFNIASDRPASLNELVRLVADYGGVPIPRWHVPVLPVWLAGLVCEAVWLPLRSRPPLSRRRVGFFTHNRAFDLSKAREHLGYVSRWDHRTGIARTIDWYREMKLI